MASHSEPISHLPSSSPRSRDPPPSAAPAPPLSNRRTSTASPASANSPSQRDTATGNRAVSTPNEHSVSRCQESLNLQPRITLDILISITENRACSLSATGDQRLPLPVYANPLYQFPVAEEGTTNPHTTPAFPFKTSQARRSFSLALVGRWVRSNVASWVMCW